MRSTQSWAVLTLLVLLLRADLGAERVALGLEEVEELALVALDGTSA
jgi:hypothetical protein